MCSLGQHMYQLRCHLADSYQGREVEAHAWGHQRALPCPTSEPLVPSHARWVLRSEEWLRASPDLCWSYSWAASLLPTLPPTRPEKGELVSPGTGSNALLTSALQSACCVPSDAPAVAPWAGLCSSVTRGRCSWPPRSPCLPFTHWSAGWGPLAAAVPESHLIWLDKV